MAQKKKKKTPTRSQVKTPTIQWKRKTFRQVGSQTVVTLPPEASANSWTHF